MTRPIVVLAGVMVGLGVAWFVGGPLPVLPVRLVSDADGALRRVSIHYCSAFYGASHETISEFVRQLDPAVVVDVVVEKRDAFDSLLAFLSVEGGCERPELRPVVTGFPVTPWSKDRYGTMVSRRGPAICIPDPLIAGTRVGAPGDSEVPALLARDGIELRTLPFRFDGGDLIGSRERIFMAANAIARNQPYDRAGRQQLIAQMEDALGKPIVVLGETAAEVPAHHIGMYLTPLGNDTVVVGDPEWGRALYAKFRPDDTSTPTDDEAQLAPFRNVHQSLIERGFNVIRVPLVVTSQPQVYITYNNGILETRDGERIFYMPVYDLPELDDMAASIYEREGIHVKRVRVTKLYHHTGSLRCLVGVLERD